MFSMLTARRLASDERGSIAVIFAIVLLPLMVFATGCLDYIKLVDFRSRLDAAALEVASLTVSGEIRDESQRRERGRNILVKALAARNFDVAASTGKVDVKVSGEDADAVVTIEAPYRLMFGRLIGIPTATVRVRQAASNHASDQEVRLFECLSAESDEQYDRLACDGV